MHPDREPQFEMKLQSQQRSELQCQATEGYLIGAFKGDHLLNRRSEWGQNLPPVLRKEENDNQTAKPQVKRTESAPSVQKYKKPTIEIMDDDKNKDGDP